MLTPVSLSSPVRHREGLRLLRHPQEADQRRPSRHPGQWLGVAGEGQDDGRAAGGDAPEPGPRRRQPGPAAGHRRLGARLLPAVPEPQGRVLQRHLERHQLVYRGQQAGEVVKDFFHKKKTMGLSLHTYHTYLTPFLYDITEARQGKKAR